MTHSNNKSITFKLLPNSNASGNPSKHQHRYHRYNDYNSVEKAPFQNLNESVPVQTVSIGRIFAVLSGAFAYGGVMSTFFLLTLPLECAVFGNQSSIALGMFVGIAGVSQLISPIVGLISDRCTHPLGRRRPFVILGGLMSISGLIVQQGLSFHIDDSRHNWYMYIFAFLFTVVGMNTIFAAMIALIPDLIPQHQIGMANGVEAFLFASGSLFAFASFRTYLNEDVYHIYSLYLCLTLVSVVLTWKFANEKPIQREFIFSMPNDSMSDSIRSLDDYAYPSKPIGWKDIKASFWISPKIHHDFFYVTISRTFYYMGISVQAFFLYYLRDIIHIDDPEGGESVLAIISQSFGALATVPIGMLSDYLGNGRKPYVFTSCAILSVTNFALLYVRKFKAVLIIASIAGLANGAYLTMDTSLAMDTLPNSEESARMLGVWGVAMFIGSALGPMIGGPLLFFTANDDDSYSFIGYAILFTLSSIYFGLSAGSLTFVKKESNASKV